LDRNASSIPGPYYNTGPFSIQTLSIILFSTIFVTSGVILSAPKCLPRVSKTVMYIVNTCWPHFCRLNTQKPHKLKKMNTFLWRSTKTSNTFTFRWWCKKVNPIYFVTNTIYKNKSRGGERKLQKYYCTHAFNHDYFSIWFNLSADFFISEKKTAES
jgi:hypothetical protein